MNRQVFITQGRPGYDYSKAEAFGELRHLTFNEFVPTGQPGIPRYNIMAELTRNLGPYLPGRDYILLSGNPVILLMVGQLLGPGMHNLLKWNSRSRSYDLAQVVFPRFD